MPTGVARLFVLSLTGLLPLLAAGGGYMGAVVPGPDPDVRCVRRARAEGDGHSYWQDFGLGKFCHAWFCRAQLQPHAFVRTTFSPVQIDFHAVKFVRMSPSSSM